jgi:2-amino-4-hydroxy-6-hydroxymethyldihydropteridine diphosphokinase
MMGYQDVFIGMGGNLGDVFASFQQVLTIFSSDPRIRNVQMSKIYQTSPVSDIPQPLYLNAVCRFQTTFSPLELLGFLQEIQVAMGQAPKPKNAPRIIDLDILFFGEAEYRTPELQIPHPKWQERLFVLIPLADLTQTLKIPYEKNEIDLQEIIQSFENRHQEVMVYQHRVENSHFESVKP